VSADADTWRSARRLRLLLDRAELSSADACVAANWDKPKEIYVDRPKLLRAPRLQSPVDFTAFKDIFDIVKHVIAATECT